MWIYAAILLVSIAGIIGSPAATDSSEVTGTDFTDSGDPPNLGSVTERSSQIPSQYFTFLV